MSSPSSPAVVKGTVPVDTQPLNQISPGSQLPEHKKASRSASSLHRKVSSKRLVGRLPITPTETSPYQSGTESDSMAPLTPTGQKNLDGQSWAVEKGDMQQDKADHSNQEDSSSKQHYRLSTAAGAVTELLGQLKDWAHTERQRQKVRRDKKAARKTKRQRMISPSPSGTAAAEKGVGEPASPISSGDEAAHTAMDAFEALIAAAEISHLNEHPKRPNLPKRNSRRRLTRSRSLKGGHTSDTDYASDGEPVVPSCEELLQTAEEVGVDEFKSQVLKLAHTLRCKGWRRVPLDRYKEVNVERISGALTNAVFMVSPPSELPSVPNTPDPHSSTVSLSSRKVPAKLLLRIYGPHVSHLINRDTELSILRRLARKRIGPRLLGTFLNGRFEEFFPSRTLTREDIRIPETSRHIAKRLKELHEGIELEKGERQRGPIVWSNWDKWVPRAGSIMAIIEANGGRTGPVVGCSWEKFLNVVERYREWLCARYGGAEGVNKTLVFAHNDTQYGNILRLEAAGKSPLLLPMNEHRQLIVIDFEYASANTLGFEFANHFCEWMANYHDPATPHVMQESQFPSLDQQRNFFGAYVEHRLVGRYTTKASSTSTPGHSPSVSFHLDTSTSTSFDLDSRAPVLSYKEEEAARQRAIDAEVERLVEEMKVWRAASHAMWCVWGIVQANVKPEGIKEEEVGKNLKDNGSTLSEEGSIVASGIKDRKDEDEDEFDYLSYAQQRALLFWGDMLALGLVKPEDIGGFIVENVKCVK